jgi:hypothetical protein
MEFAYDITFGGNAHEHLTTMPSNGEELPVRNGWIFQFNGPDIHRNAKLAKTVTLPRGLTPQPEDRSCRRPRARNMHELHSHMKRESDRAPPFRVSLIV